MLLTHFHCGCILGSFIGKLVGAEGKGAAAAYLSKVQLYPAICMGFAVHAWSRDGERWNGCLRALL
jgi:hypothetical protein